MKLIIEIDGYSHNFKHSEDVERDRELNYLGYTVLRFTEHEVKYDIDNVVSNIEYEIDRIKSIPLTPFSKGEWGTPKLQSIRNNIKIIY